MKVRTISGREVLRPGALICLLLTILATRVDAQNYGQNAVYNASGPVNTSAYIDAANFPSTAGPDFCGQLSAVLSSGIPYINSTNWQVIDARGITYTSCSANPWAGTTTWATILLPAGTITIQKTWTLPQNTRIVGQGPGITTLKAGSSLTTGPMIKMGCHGHSGMTVCATSFGVSVENLTLDGSSQGVDGIDNSDAEEQSYVKHVQMINIGGTGLSLGTDVGTSSHSGPYSDLSITETSGGSGCVNIAPGAQPRGIHGINCNSSSNSGAGIYLDGGNVSIEDVNVTGFTDGIRIGSQETGQSVQSNIIFNVTGGSGLTNVIHICGSYSTTCSTANSVTDLTLMGITRLGTGTDTIQDDVTDYTLSDATVAMYILGETQTSISGTGPGYSRFTTSPSLVPTWLVGTVSLTTGSSCAPTGALYSKTSGSGTVVWGCAGSSGWQVIK
jgi:hypothetical protein